MDTTTQLLASIGIDIGKEVFHVVGHALVRCKLGGFLKVMF